MGQLPGLRVVWATFVARAPMWLAVAAVAVLVEGIPAFESMRLNVATILPNPVLAKFASTAVSVVLSLVDLVLVTLVIRLTLAGLRGQPPSWRQALSRVPWWDLTTVAVSVVLVHRGLFWFLGRWIGHSYALFQSTVDFVVAVPLLLVVSLIVDAGMRPLAAICESVRLMSPVVWRGYWTLFIIRLVPVAIMLPLYPFLMAEPENRALGASLVFVAALVSICLWAVPYYIWVALVYHALHDKPAATPPIPE